MPNDSALCGKQHVTTTQLRVALLGADNFNFICDNVVSRNAAAASYLRAQRGGDGDVSEEIRPALKYDQSKTRGRHDP
jgi:hypothetical protein